MTIALWALNHPVLFRLERGTLPPTTHRPVRRARMALILRQLITLPDDPRSGFSPTPVSLDQRKPPPGQFNPPGPEGHGFPLPVEGPWTLRPPRFNPGVPSWTPGQVKYTPHPPGGQPRSTVFGTRGLPHCLHGSILPPAGASNAENSAYASDFSDARPPSVARFTQFAIASPEASPGLAAVRAHLPQCAPGWMPATPAPTGRRRLDVARLGAIRGQFCAGALRPRSHVGQPYGRPEWRRRRTGCA